MSLRHDMLSRCALSALSPRALCRDAFFPCGLCALSVAVCSPSRNFSLASLTAHAFFSLCSLPLFDVPHNKCRKTGSTGMRNSDIAPVSERRKKRLLRLLSYNAAAKVCLFAGVRSEHCLEKKIACQRVQHCQGSATQNDIAEGHRAEPVQKGSLFRKRTC